MKISISNIKYLKKKDTKVGIIGQISNDLHNVEMNLQELMKHTTNSKSWSSSCFNGKRCKENFESTELLVVDVDNSDKDISAMLLECKELGILPNAWYYSASHTPKKPKYRLIWIYPEVCTELRVHEVMTYIATKTVDGDMNAIDCSRLWFGTDKKGAIVHTTPLSVYNMVIAFQTNIDKSHKDKKADILSNISRKTGINIFNGNLDIIFNALEASSYQGLKQKSIKNTDTTITPINIYIGVMVASVKTDKKVPESALQATFSHLNFRYHIDNNTYKYCPTDKKGKVDVGTNREHSDIDLITNYSFEALQGNCKYYRELIKGEHNGFDRTTSMFLASQFARIEGGSKKFLQILEANMESDREHSAEWRIDNRMQILYDMQKKNSAPFYCQNNCPYYNECNSSKFGNSDKKIMAYMGQSRANIVYRKEDLDVISKEQARLILSTSYKETLHNNTKATLITCPTGLGKSQQTIENFDKGQLIALPTHEKCQETLDELIQKGHTDVVYIIARPTLYCNKPFIKELFELEVQAKQCEAIGDYKQLIKIVDKAADFIAQNYELDNNEYYNQILFEIEEHKETRILARTHNKIVCTHAFLLRMQPNHFKGIETIIIDEDICKTAQHVLTITTQQAQLIYEKTRDTTSNPGLMEAMQSAICHAPHKYRYTRLELGSKDIENLTELKLEHKITSQLDMLAIAQSLCRVDNDIFIYTVNKLVAADKKLIMLTATPNLTKILNMCVSVPFTNIEIPNTELLGEIIHHHELPCYKNYLETVEGFTTIINELKRLNINKIITYKSYKEKFEKEGIEVICTYGNELGINKFKGLDMAIIGTYLSNPMNPHLVYCALEKKDITEIAPRKIKKETSGIIYCNIGYSNKDIEDISSYESIVHLVQSVGRARLIDNKCTVHTFSNIPHPQTSNI